LPTADNNKIIKIAKKIKSRQGGRKEVAKKGTTTRVEKISETGKEVVKAIRWCAYHFSQSSPLCPAIES
jgi:hypothetical protein